MPDAPRAVVAWAPWSPEAGPGLVDVMDFTQDGMEHRARISDVQPVQVAASVGLDHVVTASVRGLAVLDLTERTRQHLAFQRNAWAVAPLGSDHLVLLHGARSSGEVTLTVTGPDPSDPLPVGELQLSVPFSELFVHGTNAFVVGAQSIGADGFGILQWRSVIHSVDLSDPSRPRLREASVQLPDPAFHASLRFEAPWGQRIRRVGDALVLLQDRNVSVVAGGACSCEDSVPDSGVRLMAHVVDLRDPDALRVTEVEVDDATEANGLQVVGNELLANVNAFRTGRVGGGQITRLKAINVADVTAPRVSDRGGATSTAHATSPDGAAVFVDTATFPSDGSMAFVLEQVLMEGMRVSNQVSLSGQMVAAAAASSSRVYSLIVPNPSRDTAGLVVPVAPNHLAMVDFQDGVGSVTTTLGVPQGASILDAIDGERVLVRSLDAAYLLRVDGEGAVTLEFSHPADAMPSVVVVHQGRLMIPGGTAGVVTHTLAP